MALDGSQRAKIRKYLGYGARYVHVGDSVEQRLEAAMDAIATEPDDEAQVLVELQRCERCDEALEKVFVLSLAVNTGGIHTDGARHMQTIRSMGTQAAARISSLLGMPLRNGGGFALSGASAE